MLNHNKKMYSSKKFLDLKCFAKQNAQIFLKVKYFTTKTIYYVNEINKTIINNFFLCLQYI